MELRIFSLLLTILSNVCVSRELEELVKMIADGNYNKQLAKIWKEMEDKTPQDIKKSGQYLIAAQLHQTSQQLQQGVITIDPNQVKYYKNINVSQAKKDCDGYCKNKLNKIRTKYESADTLDKLNRSIKGRNTAVHTELQFLYGNYFREAMKQGGIFLIYSHYIPCAGLAGSSFGECAGDLAYGLVDLRMNANTPVYFVIMYSEVFKNRGETNECVSKLYHANAGIPLLRCNQCGGNRRCEVAVGTVGADQFFHGGESIRSPLFYRFPRINKAAKSKHNQADVFIRCLAMGEFLQKFVKQDTEYRVKLSSKQLYSEDEKYRKRITTWVDKQCAQNRYNIDIVRHLVRPFAKTDAAVSDVVKRCNSYIECLPGLATSSSTCVLTTEEELSSLFDNLFTNDKSSGIS